MGRTVNRVPYNVNIPNKNDIREYVFNHSVWKGLTDDKNFITVDQETFEDAKNVYADKHNLLKSRPSLKSVSITYKDGDGNLQTVTDIERIWKFDSGILYKHKDGQVFIDDERAVTITTDEGASYNYVKLKDYLIQFSKSDTVEYTIINTVDGTTTKDFIYLPKEINDYAEQKNQLTTSFRKTYIIDDVAGVESKILGFNYDVLYNDEIIRKDINLYNVADLKKIFVKFDDVLVKDVSTDASGNDVVLCYNVNTKTYFVIHAGGFVSVTDFVPVSLSYDGNLVCGAKLTNDENGDLIITLQYYDLIDNTYSTVNEDPGIDTPENATADALEIKHVLMKDKDNYLIVYHAADNNDYAIHRNGTTGYSIKRTSYSSNVDSFYSARWYLANDDVVTLVPNKRQSTIDFYLYYNNDTKYVGTTPITTCKGSDDDSHRIVYDKRNLKINDDKTLTIRLLRYYATDSPLFVDVCVNEYTLTKSEFTNKSIYEGVNITTGATAKLSNKYYGKYNYCSYDINGTRKTRIFENAYEIDAKDEYFANFYIGNYFYKTYDNYSDTNNLILVNKTIELRQTVNGETKLFYPDIVKVFGNKIIATNGGELYISEYAEEQGEFKLYFPHKTNFYKNITNVQYISDTQFAVFFDDEIYYVTYSADTNGYIYEKSKLDVGCTEGSDVITSFDGSYSIFTSKRGLAYLSYQQFVASTDQTATFISDSINERFKKFNDGPVKLEKSEYWIYVYKPGSNELYLLDNRNGSWWYWTTPDSLTSIVITNEPKLLINGSLYTFDYTDENYYDSVNDEDSNIEWYAKSQKLHLNAVNNYKSITSFNLSTLSDSEDTVSMNLECMTYRDIFDKHKKEVLEYYVDSVKSFSKRLSYHKVMEFQYKLSYDDYSYQQLPLSLSNISVRYKIGGAIR